MQQDPARLIGMPSLVTPSSMRDDGEAFDTAKVVRGLFERLAPVLITVLVTAVALAPLLFKAERPGNEALRATLLDAEPLPTTG